MDQEDVMSAYIIACAFIYPSSSLNPERSCEMLRQIQVFIVISRKKLTNPLAKMLKIKLVKSVVRIIRTQLHKCSNGDALHRTHTCITMYDTATISLTHANSQKHKSDLLFKRISTSGRLDLSKNKLLRIFIRSYKFEDWLKKPTKL